ncbi:DUF202 domain-containing protein [[Mycobacterium] nativiensis]|uniref:DUF202 domain-containing protein n=1 Tax=[Mycobacterium] nativiensis TaxID=2855503 RepID=A0ABU5XY38_9MYCO|nr:DUF202 domain-containing protein [Mycolicibacter sp. MYC340]MEB3032818.1 DUF202 domain-containing protein [Mycolicibacter sp. MYC340]
MTGNGLRDTGDGGLQAERTALAWTRTSLAVGAGGALLAALNVADGSGAFGLATACLGLGCALLILRIANRRRRTLSLGPPTRWITPPNQVQLTGISVLTFIFVATLACLLPS